MPVFVVLARDDNGPSFKCIFEHSVSFFSYRVIPALAENGARYDIILYVTMYVLK